MYVHTPFPNIVYALNLPTQQDHLEVRAQAGSVRDPPSWRRHVNRGVQWADGKIFLYQADTTLVALDAKTGKELWKAVNGDPKRGETGTGAPIVVGNLVWSACRVPSSACAAFMTAYDINTGKRVWRAYSMGPDDEILFNPAKTTSLGKPVGKDWSLKTWNGTRGSWAAVHLGLYAWDPKLNLIYYGTGNPSTWNPAQRAGPMASRSTRSGRCPSWLARQYG